MKSIGAPLLALVALVATPVLSRPALAGEASVLDPSYVIELQFGPGVQPTYPGSRFYRPVPVPGISVRHSDEPVRFSAPDDGFGVPVVDASGFRAGPVGNVVVPRWRTHEELIGLHKVRPAVEIGAFAEYFPVDSLRMRIEVRSGVYGHDGVVATGGADYVTSADRFTFSIGPRVDVGSAAWTRTYFGVKPFEAIRNGQVYAFEGTGGIAAVGALSTMRVNVAEDWSATAYGGLKRLTGSAAASPIPTVLGSRSQLTAGLLLARSFTVGPF